VADYLLPTAFLIVVFVVFGLVHGNRRGGGCGDCDGACDKTRCEKS